MEILYTIVEKENSIYLSTHDFASHGVILGDTQCAYVHWLEVDGKWAVYCHYYYENHYSGIGMYQFHSMNIEFNKPKVADVITAHQDYLKTVALFGYDKAHDAKDAQS